MSRSRNRTTSDCHRVWGDEGRRKAGAAIKRIWRRTLVVLERSESWLYRHPVISAYICYNGKTNWLRIRSVSSPFIFYCFCYRLKMLLYRLKYIAHSQGLYFLKYNTFIHIEIKRCRTDNIFLLEFTGISWPNFYSDPFAEKDSNSNGLHNQPPPTFSISLNSNR